MIKRFSLFFLSLTVWVGSALGYEGTNVFEFEKLDDEVRALTLNGSNTQVVFIRAYSQPYWFKDENKQGRDGFNGRNGAADYWKSKMGCLKNLFSQIPSSALVIMDVKADRAYKSTPGNLVPGAVSLQGPVVANALLDHVGSRRAFLIQRGNDTVSQEDLAAGNDRVSIASSFKGAKVIGSSLWNSGESIRNIVTHILSEMTPAQRAVFQTALMDFMGLDAAQVEANLSSPDVIHQSGVAASTDARLLEATPLENLFFHVIKYTGWY